MGNRCTTILEKGASSGRAPTSSVFQGASFATAIRIRNRVAYATPVVKLLDMQRKTTGQRRSLRLPAGRCMLCTTMLAPIPSGLQ